MQVFRRKKSEATINSPYHQHSRSVSGPLPLAASSSSLQHTPPPNTPLYEKFAASSQQRPLQMATPSQGRGRGGGGPNGINSVSRSPRTEAPFSDRPSATAILDVTTDLHDHSPQRSLIHPQPITSNTPPLTFKSVSPMPLSTRRSSLVVSPPSDTTNVFEKKSRRISMAVFDQNKPLPPPQALEVPPVPPLPPASEHHASVQERGPSPPHSYRQQTRSSPLRSNQQGLPPLTSAQVQLRTSSVDSNTDIVPCTSTPTKLKKRLPQTPPTLTQSAQSNAHNIPAPIVPPNHETFDSNHGRRYSPLAAFGPIPPSSPRNGTAREVAHPLQSGQSAASIIRESQITNGDLPQPPINAFIGNRQLSSYIVSSPAHTRKSLEETRQESQEIQRTTLHDSPVPKLKDFVPQFVPQHSNGLTHPESFIPLPPPAEVPLDQFPPARQLVRPAGRRSTDEYRPAINAFPIPPSHLPNNGPLTITETIAVSGNESTPANQIHTPLRPNDVPGRKSFHVSVPRGPGLSDDAAKKLEQVYRSSSPPSISAEPPLPAQQKQAPMGQKTSLLRVRNGEESSIPQQQALDQPTRRQLPMVPNTPAAVAAHGAGHVSVGSVNTSFVEIPPRSTHSGPTIARTTMSKSGSASSSGSGSIISNEHGFRAETPASSLHDFGPGLNVGSTLSNGKGGAAEQAMERNVEGVARTPSPLPSNAPVKKEAKPYAPIAIPLESVKKVSYSPMPAKRKGDIEVDKRGRVIAPPQSKSPAIPPAVPDEEKLYPLLAHLLDLPLFAALLPHLSFFDYLAVSSVSPVVRSTFDEERNFREEILEKYLASVGYWRWERLCAEGEPNVVDPLFLNLKDLNAYMRAVSIPTHRYADMADIILQNHSQGHGNGSGQVKLLSKTCRAYSRVVLRLRAQAEAEAELLHSTSPGDAFPGSGSREPAAPTSFHLPSRDYSRPPSRAASVESSTDHFSTSSRMSRLAPLHPKTKFRSPLYRPNHAPLLRVFVLSPDGPWLSDATILECEKELKRTCSGAKGRLSKNLLRVGDVIWNCSVGDEGNLGRSVWDGTYLIDLDYTFSKIGAIPKYLHSLSFSPSYFHKVLRMGTGVDADPIIQVDVAPFGDQICANLQLLQERVPLETPQGGRHTVLRWTHRSRFRIPDVRRSQHTLAIPIPNTDNAFIDASWAGSVIVEAEGTNEGLAELQARCGSAFPQYRGRQIQQTSRVFRLLRERSRPGEIWIRLVREKDRLM